jgi:hypothetical protein
MAAIIALLVIVFVSLLVVRVGSKALMMTGLSWDTASFQSYSAFFGVGFTTREAEMVVNHPIRRRIIRDLIFAGNVGLTSALATLVVSVMQAHTGKQAVLLIGTIVGGLAGLILLFRVKFVQSIVDAIIQKAVRKAGLVRVLDYELLLRVQAGYCVSEIEVLKESPLVGRSLSDSRPWDKGVVILAIKRNDQTLSGIPNRSDVIEVGDVLTAYGREEDLKRIATAEV